MAVKPDLTQQRTARNVCRVTTEVSALLASLAITERVWMVVLEMVCACVIMAGDLSISALIAWRDTGDFTALPARPATSMESVIAVFTAVVSANAILTSIGKPVARIA